ncbi:histidine phosphatase family protein [Cronobacter dublinensis]|uniref:histidine phosphatase family protein n=1 Tax=Cronobacter dublinensis TaxID=413497 RepID=UPI0024AE6719|nr:histidine phosphatase family protein [Cronobacter dublinensis]MDI6445953.1 histidine phosphatase family protein [Cronobacter dublinensis]MDI7390573.1 histidine phosphatase family protein [Cronobacter dublinensis]
MNLILIRHAETAWNRGGLIQGHQDSALTARGLQETTALLTALAHDFPSVDMVYTSPAGRARHMGDAIASHFGCPLSVEPLVQEQSFGDYEGLSRPPRLVSFIQSTDLSFSTSNGKMKCIRKMEL